VLGMSILHLLKDRGAVLAKVHRMLKPGGRFLSSTVCIADMGRFPRLLAPVLRGLGLIPIASLDSETLLAEIAAAGFEIEDHWRPGPGQPIFVVAKRG